MSDGCPGCGRGLYDCDCSEEEFEAMRQWLEARSVTHPDEGPRCFESYGDAMAWFDQAQQQWSESYLCEVVRIGSLNLRATLGRRKA